MRLAIPRMAADIAANPAASVGAPPAELGGSTSRSATANPSMVETRAPDTPGTPVTIWSRRNRTAATVSGATGVYRHAPTRT